MSIALTDSFAPTFIPKRTKLVRLHFEFEDEPNKMTPDEFHIILKSPRSLHFIVKPTEEGTGELDSLLHPSLHQ